jgi:peptidyl-prolyl cis-trans isomerase SurA
VAREVSEDGSAARGGDLGWASPGNFVPEFEEAMNRLPLGGISPPVVIALRRAPDPGGGAAQRGARPEGGARAGPQPLREQKFDATYQEWAKELRLRAYIELREPPV